MAWVTNCGGGAVSKVFSSAGASNNEPSVFASLRVKLFWAESEMAEE